MTRKSVRFQPLFTDDKAVIVAIGRSRAAADRLAEQLTDLVASPEPGDP